MKINLSLLLLFCLSELLAQQKTFVKEYYYQASELDSKVSSRAIATNQLRTILLNEIGVYVQTESLLKTSDIMGKFSQDFVETISTISAGVTKFEILDETWDGKTYWMRASITIDQEQLKESLKQVANDRQRVKELESLKQQLIEAKIELANLQKDFEDAELPIKEDSIVNKYNKKISQLKSSEFVYNAIARITLHDYKGAILEFSEALKIDSRNSYAFYGRGLSKAVLLDYSGAIMDYTIALALDPGNVRYYILRGISKATTPRPNGEPLDHAGAIDDFTHAINLDPSNVQALLLRGSSNAVLKNYMKAIADYNSVIDIDHKNIDAYNSRGISKVRLNDFRGAIDDFTTIIQFDAGNIEALIGRGSSKNMIGDYKGAIKDLTRAIELDPDNSLAYFNRGVSRMNLDQRIPACADLSKAGQLGDKQAYELISKYCN